MKINKKNVVNGKEAMIGLVGKALNNFEENGKVFVRGEIWNAYANSDIKRNELIIVEKITGLNLFVDRFSGRAVNFD